MKTRWAAVTVILILQVPLFLLASQSVIDVTMLQLRTFLVRERLLNYELSSRLLQARFLNMTSLDDDLTGEIRMNVLESTVLNFDTSEMLSEHTFTETLGLYIVNAVRFLSFKPLIRLKEDQEKTLMLQSAFLLERDRHYKKASDIYTRLEGMLRTSDQDYPFVLLHNGYCLAVTGEKDRAREKLNTVIRLFHESHYAKTSKLILALMDEGKRRTERIEKSGLDERSRALALHRSGQFLRSLELYRSLPQKTYEDQYYEARNMEELGDVTSATEVYLALAKQTADRETAVKANRRLLMIGSFYRKDESLKETAANNAENLGDRKTMEEIREGAALQLSPVVIEILKEKAKEAEAKGETDRSLDVILNLNKEIDKVIEEEKRKTAEITSAEIRKKEEERKPLTGAEMPKPVIRLGLRLELVDGRTLATQRIEISGENVLLTGRNFSITLPLSMIAGITIEDTDGIYHDAELYRHAKLEIRTITGKVYSGSYAVRRNEQFELSDGKEKHTVKETEFQSAQGRQI